MLTKTTLYCKLANLNWSLLPALPDRLRSIGFSGVRKPSIDVWRYPLSISFDDYQDVMEYVRNNGEPRGYKISVYEEGSLKKYMRLDRSRTKWDDEDSLILTVEGCGSAEDLKSLAAFLGFEPDTIVSKPTLQRSAFIAHRFNPEGDELAERLARFLELLGFDITSGRAFAPGSVTEKVRARLAEREIVFAILTHGEDKTWLVQESLLAALSEKPLFLVKEENYIHSGALLSDHEYIPFKSPRIETAFIPVIEGLRELGFKF